MTEQYDGHWQESLSEETRRMVNDASFKVWQQFFDEVLMTPQEKKRRDKLELAKRVRLIAIDLELSGEFADAAILMEAAESITKEAK